MPVNAQKNFIGLLLFTTLGVVGILTLFSDIFIFSFRTMCWFTILAFALAVIYNTLVLRLHILSLPQAYLCVTFFYTSSSLTVYALGQDDIIDTFLWFDEKYAVLAVIMIISAVCWFQAGISLAYAKRIRNNLQQNTLVSVNPHKLFRIGLFSFLLSIAVIVGYTLADSGLMPMITQGYMEYVRMRIESDVRIFATILNWLLPLSSMILAASWRIRNEERIAYFSAVITLAIFLLSGDRGGGFGFLLGFILTMKMAGKRYTNQQIAVVALLILIAIPLVGEWRMSEEYRSTDIRQSLFIRSLREMGTSFQVLMSTIQIIPNEEGYRYGSSYIWALYRIIPNLGGWRQQQEQQSLTAWMTEHLTPHAIDGYGGVGFLQIAEFYVQFGVLGIVVGYFLLGYTLTRWQLRCDNSLVHPRWMAMSGITLYILTLWIRNEAIVSVRPIIWSLLFIMVGEYFFGRKKISEP